VADGTEAMRDAGKVAFKVPCRELASLIGDEEAWSSVASETLGQQSC
jgi:hypothetical protein